MRPRALAVALGWHAPRNETTEAVANDLAAFLRKRGAKVEQSDAMTMTFTAPSFPGAFVAEVMGANIIVEQVAGPATQEMAPDLPIWRESGCVK